MHECWFVGLTTVDLVHRVARPPTPNEKITATAQWLAAGGPAANAAVAAAAWGAHPLLISAVGSGPIANIARVDVADCGVDVVDVAPDHVLSISSVLVDDSSGRRSVVSTDGGSAVIDATVLAVAATQPAPRVMLLDGHHPDLMRWAMDYSTRAGISTVLDAGRWRPIFAELIGQVDVVACSADFTLADGSRGLDALRSAGARRIVITDGSGPITWYDGTSTGVTSVPPVAAVDTLGAGDVFHGVFTAEVGAGTGLAEAVERAAQAASTRVMHAGPRSFLPMLRKLGAELRGAT